MTVSAVIAVALTAAVVLAIAPPNAPDTDKELGR